MMDCGGKERSPPIGACRVDIGSGGFRVKRIREGGRASAQERHQWRSARSSGSGRRDMGRWLTTSERIESTRAIPLGCAPGGPGGTGALAAIPARRITGGRVCWAARGVVRWRLSIKALRRMLPGKSARHGVLHQISSPSICFAFASRPKGGGGSGGTRVGGGPVISGSGETKAKYRREASMSWLLVGKIPCIEYPARIARESHHWRVGGETSGPGSSLAPNSAAAANASSDGAGVAELWAAKRSGGDLTEGEGSFPSGRGRKGYVARSRWDQKISSAWSFQWFSGQVLIHLIQSGPCIGPTGDSRCPSQLRRAGSASRGAAKSPLSGKVRPSPCAAARKAGDASGGTGRQTRGDPTLVWDSLGGQERSSGAEELASEAAGVELVPEELVGAPD